MRCKNCGSENNDNLYICQNCGSPLYDEDDAINAADDSTRMFNPPVNQNANGYNNYVDNFNNESQAYHQQRAAERARQKKEESDKKKQVAIIVILAIVLIAIIAGIIIAVAHGKKAANDVTLTGITTSASSDVSDTSAATSSTTETTESTTESTTASTTTEREGKDYKITVGTNDSGYAEGDGTYKKGDTATVWCGADDNSEFIGWYKNGSKVSSSTRYTFTVDGDAYLEARFKKKSTTKATTKKATTKATTKKATTKKATTKKSTTGSSDSDTDEEEI